MDQLEALLQELHKETAWLRAFVFIVVSFTCAWRAMRSQYFRKVLAWIAVLTGTFVVTGPLIAYWPHLRVFTQAATTPILLILGFHCVEYLYSDPPDFRKLFHHNDTLPRDEVRN